MEKILRIVQRDCLVSLRFYWLTTEWRQSAKNIPTVQQNNSHHNSLLHLLPFNLRFFFVYAAVSVDLIRNLWMNFDILFISDRKDDNNKNTVDVQHVVQITELVSMFKNVKQMWKLMIDSWSPIFIPTCFSHPSTSSPSSFEQTQLFFIPIALNLISFTNVFQVKSELFAATNLIAIRRQTCDRSWLVCLFSSSFEWLEARVAWLRRPNIPIRKTNLKRTKCVHLFCRRLHS